MIRLQGVSKSYGSHKVVDDVSLDIAPASVTSIIGPNGAGKSTLLSMASRLIDADEGEIFVGGRELSGLSPTELAKKISVLKQANNVNLRLTIRDLVVFGRFPHSKGRFTAEDWDHADRAIEYVGLGDMADKYIDQLSGGERQRAFFAMVIAQDTDCILLDEPLNNLDMKQAVKLMKTVERLVDDFGKTVVIVIHDINFASFYSDYVVAMKDGRVIHTGSADEMIRPAVLRDVYDMDIQVERVSRRNVCMFYT